MTERRVKTGVERIIEDKQFTIDQTTSDIIVCEDGDMKFWVEDYEDIERMVNRMNELYEKSKRLEREVYKLKRERNASNKQSEKWESQAIEEIDRLKRKNEELKDWKDNCLNTVSENSILWNEIFVMMEQGAKPSSAFEKFIQKAFPWKEWENMFRQGYDEDYAKKGDKKI